MLKKHLYANSRLAIAPSGFLQSAWLWYQAYHDRFSNKNIYWETDPFYGPVKKNSFSLVDNILVTEEKYQEYWI